MHFPVWPQTVYSQLFVTSKVRRSPVLKSKLAADAHCMGRQSRGYDSGMESWEDLLSSSTRNWSSCGGRSSSRETAESKSGSKYWEELHLDWLFLVCWFLACIDNTVECLLYLLSVLCWCLKLESEGHTFILESARAGYGEDSTSQRFDCHLCSYQHLE